MSYPTAPGPRVRVRVKGGTRSDDSRRLCDTCHHGHVMRGPADSDLRISCQVLGRGEEMPTFKIVECTEYSDKTQPSLADMKRTAWILASDNYKNSIGFIRADKWRKDHGDDEIIPERD